MKLTVTPELAVLIKTIRARNRVSSKDLAEHIKKSYSYISKLENGDVKNISEEDLTDILTFVSGGGDFYEEVLPGIVRTYDSFVDQSCLVDQLWLIHYDVVKHPLHVPEEMADDMKRIMDEHGITTDKLVDMINSNADTEAGCSFPENVYTAMNSYGNTRLMIRCHVERKEVADILSKKNLDSYHYVLQYMVYNIFRLEDYPEYTAKLPAEKATVLLKKVAEYHHRFGVRSLINFVDLMASDFYVGSLSNPQHKVVSSYNKEDEFALGAIIELFREAMLLDPVGASQSLESLQHNLMWDTAFILKIMGIPFAKLGSLSYMQKKKLLGSIDGLIEKFDQLSDFEKKFEVY